MITRDTVASQLRDYLQRRATRAALVDWAERAMMEEDFDGRDLETIRDITSRLGLADVREFGLTWRTAKAICRVWDIKPRSTSSKRPDRSDARQDSSDPFEPSEPRCNLVPIHGVPRAPGRADDQEPGHDPDLSDDCGAGGGDFCARDRRAYCEPFVRERSGPKPEAQSLKPAA